MRNYLIVLDTTSGANLEMSQNEGFELIPLSVLVDGEAYKDQYEITKDTLYTQLRSGKVPTTSQPTTGLIMEKMEEWKEKNYEFILILTCSSDLSGTNHGFHLAKNTVGLDNCYIVDTRSFRAS